MRDYVINVVTPFYETSLFGAIVGFLGSLIIFLITQNTLNKQEQKRAKRNQIILLVQSNNDLFLRIYAGSKNKENFDFLGLRQSLNNSNGLFLLSGPIKKHFDELYEIHSNPKEYPQKKSRIFYVLEKIIAEIEKYGDDIFESK